jgi:heme/copper-type cytochrome/quinol oxidase subunit 2
MRSTVVVEEKSTFEAWLKEQPTFAESLAAARMDATEKDVKLVLNKEPAQSGAIQAISNR